MAERMATWIVWAVINSHREMDAFKKSQEKKEWLQRGDFPPDNSDVNITVLGGLGAMGLPGCKALSTLGYSVCTCSRTSAKSGELEGFPSIRQITFAELDEQLPKTDVLICLLPLTDSTRGIISQGMLSKLKWGSTVVNAGRGAHVVEEDLVAALDSGVSLQPIMYGNSSFKKCIQSSVARHFFPCKQTFHQSTKFQGQESVTLAQLHD